MSIGKQLRVDNSKKKEANKIRIRTRCIAVLTNKNEVETAFG